MGSCPKVSSPHPNKPWARAFIDRGRGLHPETAQSAQVLILKLVIGGLTDVILIVLSTVNLVCCDSWGRKELDRTERLN